LYAIRKNELFAAAGYDSKEALRSALEAPEKANWGGIPEIKAALGSLGGEVSFALVADPLRIVASRAGKPGAAEPAPVILATGRGGGSAGAGLWARLDVAVPVIREAIKHRNALQP
jgi:hypothetical protein